MDLEWNMWKKVLLTEAAAITSAFVLERLWTRPTRCLSILSFVSLFEKDKGRWDCRLMSHCEYWGLTHRLKADKLLTSWPIICDFLLTKKYLFVKPQKFIETKKFESPRKATHFPTAPSRVLPSMTIKNVSTFVRLLSALGSKKVLWRKQEKPHSKTIFLLS